MVCVAAAVSLEPWLTIVAIVLDLVAAVHMYCIRLRTLFGQNLWRCCSVDGPAPRAATAKAILMFTVPIVSEAFDTVKDWIVCGQCLLVPVSVTGFAFGAAFSLADLALSSYVPLPSFLPVWPPLLMVQGLLVAAFLCFLLCAFFCLLVPSVPVLAMLPCLLHRSEICLLFLPFAMCYALVCIPLLGYVPALRSPFGIAERIASAGWNALSGLVQPDVLDGGCLFTASAYTIVFAHVAAWHRNEAKRDLLSAFLVVPFLPTRLLSVPTATCTEYITVKMSNLAVDFLSHARLVIAWGEDWPQGFIGIFVGRVTESSFAWVSAAASLSKGLLIPILQSILRRIKQQQVKWHLNRLIDTRGEELPRCVKKQLQVSQMLNKADMIVRMHASLKDLSTETLHALNVKEGKSLVEAFFAMRDAWLEETMRRDGFEVLCAKYIQAHQQKLPTSWQEVRRDGYSSKVCHLAGATFQALQNAGYSVKDCVQAGFTSKELAALGYDARTLKTLGLTAKQLRDNNFSAEECKVAGYSIVDMKNAEFSAGECWKADFADDELKQAFSKGELAELARDRARGLLRR